MLVRNKPMISSCTVRKEVVSEDACNLLLKVLKPRHPQANKAHWIDIELSVHCERLAALPQFVLHVIQLKSWLRHSFTWALINSLASHKKGSPLPFLLHLHLPWNCPIYPSFKSRLHRYFSTDSTTSYLTPYIEVGHRQHLYRLITEIFLHRTKCIKFPKTSWYMLGTRVWKY